MKDFATLFTGLDETNKTSEKVRLISEYFAKAEPADAAWAIYFLTGRKIRQLVPTSRLAEWAIELSGSQYWMFGECYEAVGDLAETIALLLPPPNKSTEEPLTVWVEKHLLPLRNMPEAEQKVALLDAWDKLNEAERFVMNKIITGAFRVGVSHQLVVKALSKTSELDEATVAHRLMGEWSPSSEFYEQLVQKDITDSATSRPYPFYLAYPLDDEPTSLGDVSDWLAEWKWDGIRSQVIKRDGEVFIWSRGEELITERFPEISEAAKKLPDGTVLDGEILAWRDGQVLSFGDLQPRITRKTLTKKMMQEIPVVVLAYDLLEHDGADIRDQPMTIRRQYLEEVVAKVPPDSNSTIKLSPRVEASTWETLASQREQSRRLRVEGVMLKRLQSSYGVGRRKGDWWKWKINPLTVDAVLIYAQRGQGKRASLYTDYTFGVWNEQKLVPVAKAYSGLTDAEIKQVDAFIRQNTVEKFGPVRTVKPELVFELAFEGIQRSTRHKSGVAVRFPRILRWRTDKSMEEADSLDTLTALLEE